MKERSKIWFMLLIWGAMLLMQPVSSPAQSTPSMTFTTANPEWVQTIAPENNPDNELVISGIIPLADSRQIGSLRAKDFNREVANDLRRQLFDHLEVPGTELKRLSLAGYGVPAGNYRDNELNATQRAIGLKNYQTAAVDIIRNVEVTAGREEQLMMLGGGELYARLQQTAFPEVCRIEFQAVLERSQAVSPDKIQGIMALTDMYNTAQALTKGTTDYCDLLDLAARLYPSNSVACINGAAVALMRGDLDRAGQLLAGLETDPNAYCNYGVYYMLKGEPEKAEIYLLMAASGNVEEAKAALEALKAMENG